MNGGTKRPTLKESLLRLQALVEEIRSYANFKRTFLNDYDELYQKYQKTNMSYEDYRQKLSKLLSGKSKQEWIAYYDAYLYLLYKKVDFYTDVVRQIVAAEDAESVFPEPADVKERFLKLVKEDQEKIEKRAQLHARQEGIFKKHERREYLSTIEASKLGITKKFPVKKIEELVDLEEKAADLAVGTGKRTHEVVGRRRRAIREGRTNIDVDSFASDVDFDEQADKSLEVKSFWKTGIFKKILHLFFGDKIDQQSFLSKDITIGTSLLTQERLARIAHDNSYEKENIDLSLLTQESIKLR